MSHKMFTRPHWNRNVKTRLVLLWFLVHFRLDILFFILNFKLLIKSADNNKTAEAIVDVLKIIVAINSDDYYRTLLNNYISFFVSNIVH